MDIINEFLNTYGVTILYTIVTAIGGFLGMAIKRLCQKFFDDATKKSVAKICVKAVEQMYKDLHGEDKLNQCVQAMASLLDEKGIHITEIEIRMLIEAAVNEMNSQMGDIFATMPIEGAENKISVALL